MSGHFILKCSECGKILMQCRCPSLDKPVIYKVCDDCTDKKPLESPDAKGIDWWNDFGSTIPDD